MDEVQKKRLYKWNTCSAVYVYLSMAAHEHRKYLYCVNRQLGTLVRYEGLTAVTEE
jgi:hypothetical protein